MGRVKQTQAIEVRIGECECPDTPHAETGDRAFLRPRLTPEGGMAASYVLAQMQKGDGLVDYMRTMGMVLLEDGLIRWDVQDDDGEPAPTDRMSLRSGMYDYDETLKPIVDRCFELYEETVLHPLEAMVESQKKRPASTSSNGGLTRQSTSAPTQPSAAPPGP